MPTDLRSIADFEELIAYLGDELGWPVEEYGLDELTFEYDADELGLKDEEAEKLKDGSIRQLRPLPGGQPFGIFFVEFAQAKLPVVVLRRILNALVVKKRNSANPADRQRWAADDLLFISAFGEDDEREIAFAHFQTDPDTSELPVLRVLGWHGSTTKLKTKYVADVLKNRLSWPADPSNHEVWRQEWSKAFRSRLGHEITTAKELAKVLAQFARRVRDAARTVMSYESETGRMRLLHKGFKEALIHDLNEDDFTTYYAETICYGLFTVAVSKTELSEGKYGTAIATEDVAHFVPVTNQFLRKILWSFLEAGGRAEKLNFDDLGINEIVALLNGEETNLPAILLDFGNSRPGEDPVIHLYEDFLKEFDAELRKKRGVYYTPKPVVSYIVGAVHEQLQTEFALKDGLASIITWGEMLKKRPDLKLPPLTDLPGEKETISPREAFVQILDPATGTATFLVEVIDVIYKHLSEEWETQGLSAAAQNEAWNAYVPKHLLPRLHGYELMMAPYAIAHMKIGLKLAETGYRFSTEERVRIYLTNALEPWVQQLPLIGFDALAREAITVNEIKRHKRYTVVIGNPPYAVKSYNNSPWILNLIEDFKRGLNETKINLDDDFIKFLRFAANQAEISHAAVVGMITNNIFLSGVTHRQMRGFLLDQFRIACFINLHGDSRYSEIPPDGLKNDNVFKIQQGVSISVFSQSGQGGRRNVSYGDVWGSHSEKCQTLQDSEPIPQTIIEPCAPNYFIQIPSSIDTSEYLSWHLLTEWMPIFSNGIETHKDALTVHFTKQELNLVAETLLSQEIETARVLLHAGKDGRDWKLHKAVESLRSMSVPRLNVQTITYRPFDFRYTALNHESGGFIAYPRWDVMSHLVDIPGNLALVSARLQARGGEWDSALVTRFPTEKKTGDSTRSSTIFPLFVNRDSFFHLKIKNSPNVSQNRIQDIRSIFGAHCAAPLIVLSYLYALMHSPGYRSRYGEFLKINFPRLPLTRDRILFRRLARLGGKLIATHILESPTLDAPTTEFIGENRQITNVGWTADRGGTVWLDGKKPNGKPFQPGTSGFRPIPEEVWNFHIGGYQVCEKWLKDRGPKKGQPGRTLSDEDIAHYHKIVIALTETIRLMAEIDEVIDAHGGWPAAFTQPETAQKSDA